MTTEMTTEMTGVRRITLPQVSPEVYKAVVALDAAASKDLDPELAELIKNGNWARSSRWPSRSTPGTESA
ncbi:hypothetical protein [Mycolicibacterium flavescens]|uniref:Uncharacterized protein n=1 Tax=Mycolicibacterium flavescens TaxID=1776 RepID=A0A1E3RBB8_MYCFV|nr:hypothetical protein BHQ18_25090 [Mycolicibacterium flavescens]